VPEHQSAVEHRNAAAWPKRIAASQFHCARVEWRLQGWPHSGGHDTAGNDSERGDEGASRGSQHAHLRICERKGAAAVIERGGVVVVHVKVGSDQRE
jgi:hypothetical protein